MRRCRTRRCGVFIGCYPCYPTIVEPNDPEVMITEAGPSLAILPRFILAAKLSVARCSHDRKNSLFRVAWIDQHRFLLKRTTTRQHGEQDDQERICDDSHRGEVFLPRHYSCVTKVGRVKKVCLSPERGLRREVQSRSVVAEGSTTTETTKKETST